MQGFAGCDNGKTGPAGCMLAGALVSAKRLRGMQRERREGARQNKEGVGAWSSSVREKKAEKRACDAAARLLWDLLLEQNEPERLSEERAESAVAVQVRDPDEHHRPVERLRHGHGGRQGAQTVTQPVLRVDHHIRPRATAKQLQRSDPPLGAQLHRGLHAVAESERQLFQRRLREATTPNGRKLRGKLHPDHDQQQPEEKCAASPPESSKP
eukprot:6197015-Pleurochrysis_carterae.AAC.3